MILSSKRPGSKNKKVRLKPVTEIQYPQALTVFTDLPFLTSFLIRKYDAINEGHDRVHAINVRTITTLNTSSGPSMKKLVSNINAKTTEPIRMLSPHTWTGNDLL